MSETVLASSLHATRLEPFDAIWRLRLDGIDPTVALVYLIDTVPSEALPYLGQQFDVMGLKGWDFCNNDQQRRELIKNAIEIHKYKGTRYGITRALQSIGFNDATFDEGIDVPCDGRVMCDGTIDCGASWWAIFSITFDLGNYTDITSSQIGKLKFLVNEYKPARCLLLGTGFTATFDDDVPDQDDTLSLDLALDLSPDTMPTAVYCNGSVLCNGVVRCNGELDNLNLQYKYRFSEALPSIPVTCNGMVFCDGSITCDDNQYTTWGDTGMPITLTYRDGRTVILTA